MVLDCGQDDSAVAVILLDPVWNPEVSSFSEETDEPLLLIRFDSISSVKLSGFHQIGNIQRGISEVTATNFSDEEAGTIWRDHYGGIVELRHFSLVDVLIVSSNEEPLAPGLSEPPPTA